MRARLQKLGKKKFVRDTVALQLANVVQSGTYFITSVLTARGLGREDLGRWATSRELYMFVFFLTNMGLTNAAVSRYSEAVGRQDRRAAVDALAALLKLGAIMVGAIVLVGALGAPWAAERFYDDRQVGVVTRILCFASIGEVLRSLALAVLNGTRQMRQYAIFDTITNVARVGLVGLALLLERTPEAVAWAFLAHGLLSGVLALDAYRRARRGNPSLAPPPLVEVLAAVPPAPLRQFFGLSFLLALSKAMDTVVPRLGILLIPWLARAQSDVDSAAQGFRDNGAYQIGIVLTMVLGGAVGAIAKVVLPTLGLRMGTSDVPIDRLGGTLRRLSLAAGGVTAAATLASLPVMWLVVRVFYGDEYHDAFEYYCLLASSYLFIGFAVVVEPFYIYAGRMRVAVVQNLVYATLATVGIYSAAHLFGPKGAAAAGGLCRIFVLFHLVYIGRFFRHVRRRNDARQPAVPTP